MSLLMWIGIWEEKGNLRRDFFVRREANYLDAGLTGFPSMDSSKEDDIKVRVKEEDKEVCS